MILSTNEIIEVTGGKLSRLRGGETFSRFVVDSREASLGALFIALPGERVHGKDFAWEACQNGAIGVLSDQEIDSEVPQIVVNDAKEALFHLAAYARERLKNATIIGITGSVGKTTTKDMIASILEEKFRVFKSPRSFNSQIGLPLTLLNAPSDTQVLISEVGSQRPGELRPLASLLSPKIGVLTRLARAHLVFFNNITGVAKEKRVLFELLPEDGFAILNKDTPAFSLVEEAVPPSIKTITYGIESGDISVSDVMLKEFESIFWIEGIRFRLPLPGKGFVEDALAAIAVSSLMGVTLPEAANNLSLFKPQPGRMQRITLGDIEIINDAYNSNPDSLSMLLRAIPEVSNKRVIFVLGDMLELGLYEIDLHKEVGHLFATLGHKELVTVGNLAKEIAKTAKKIGVQNVHSFEGIPEAATFLKGYLKPGDRVVLKASRAIGIDVLIEELKKDEDYR